MIITAISKTEKVQFSIDRKPGCFAESAASMTGVQIKSFLRDAGFIIVVPQSDEDGEMFTDADGNELYLTENGGAIEGTFEGRRRASKARMNKIIAQVHTANTNMVQTRVLS